MAKRKHHDAEPGAQKAQHRDLTVELPDRHADAVTERLCEQGALGVRQSDDETRSLDKGFAPTGRATLVATFVAAAGLEARVAGELSALFTQLEAIEARAAGVSTDGLAPTVRGGGRRPLEIIGWADVEEQDWNAAWKAQWQPMRMGERLIVCPSWLSVDAKPSDVVLTLDPGMAFGTGTHATTQLCAMAIERFCAPGKGMLDVGCGSGILALFAAKLGAAPVLAIDNDPDAVAIAQQNARDNGLEGQVRFAVTRNVGVAGSFEVVVANILLAPLVELCDAILARLAPDGTLVLSGLLWEQLDTVSKAYRARGLRERERQQREEWGALIMGR